VFEEMFSIHMEDAYQAGIRLVKEILEANKDTVPGN
jgi:hypothetical protein